MFSAADSWELESSTAAPLLISEPQEFVLGRNADCLKLLPALDQRVSDEGKSVSRRQATLRVAADASELILTSQSKSNRTGVRRGASSEWDTGAYGGGGCRRLRRTLHACTAGCLAGG